jgi:ABC-type glycerol-3-phosphate transport system substrate-binding protein
VPGPSQSLADHQNGFAEGKYALNWTGNWLALSSLETFGDDLLFLPAPDFGEGGKIGAGSWQFAVSATSEHQDGANAFIEFALQDEYFAAFSDGIGLIPPTREAAAMSEYYAPGAPMEVFYELSEATGHSASGDAGVRGAEPGVPKGDRRHRQRGGRGDGARHRRRRDQRRHPEQRQATATTDRSPALQNRSSV